MPEENNNYPISIETIEAAHQFTVDLCEFMEGVRAMQDTALELELTDRVISASEISVSAIRLYDTAVPITTMLSMELEHGIANQFSSEAVEAIAAYIKRIVLPVTDIVLEANKNTFALEEDSLILERLDELTRFLNEGKRLLEKIQDELWVTLTNHSLFLGKVDR